MTFPARTAPRGTSSGIPVPVASPDAEVDKSGYDLIFNAFQP
jgi:hypothetical protein